MSVWITGTLRPGESVDINATTDRLIKRMDRFPCLPVGWDQGHETAMWAFELANFVGPFSTAPEEDHHEPGWGGCEALNPRWDPPRTSNKTYRWNRWWLAMDRRHKRAGRRRLLLARMGLDPRAVGVPGWVSG